MTWWWPIPGNVGAIVSFGTSRLRTFHRKSRRWISSITRVLATKISVWACCYVSIAGVRKKEGPCEPIECARASQKGPARISLYTYVNGLDFKFLPVFVMILNISISENSIGLYCILISKPSSKINFLLLRRSFDFVNNIFSVSFRCKMLRKVS